MPSMEMSEMKEMKLLRLARLLARVYRQPICHSYGSFKGGSPWV